ncbi:hypothetical protein O3P69_018502 [Scylla paramamosain]|uniref:Origin recognition complex subunit 3 n=1 Tax=Scylla paramamosain TaxID=85552 RepID=A0AAW0T3Q5_SCYPA
MAGTVSVSKGVFAFKRQRQSKSKNGPRVSTLDYWSQALEWGEEGEAFKELTYRNYTRCWTIASDILQELQDNIHSRVFQSLITYIDRAGRKLTSLTVAPDLPSSLVHSLASVPTACLVTGVNMPDRDATFDSLVGLLRASVTPHVARLQSKECSTLRAAMYKMISQLIGGGGWATLEDDEEEEVVMAGPKVKRRQCTMAVLSVWYREQLSTGEEDPGHTKSPIKATQSPRKRAYPSSPRKKPFPGSPSKLSRSPVKRALSGSPSKTERDPQEVEGSPRKKIKSSIISQLPERSSKPPLVVILEDLESFHPRVLSDLVLICSEYRQAVPIVLVFGVATTPDKVHQSLSHNASACLAMEVFRAEPSTHYLTRVIEKVLMSTKLPFHLGGRPFKLLLDIFLYNDLSVENFIKGLKVCMMEHFMGHASSVLCCPAANRPALLRNVTSAQLDLVRKLPSFKTFVEAAPPKEQVALLLDDSHTKEVILSLLDKVDVWYARFCVLVKVVNALTNRIPGAPLGRQVREVLAVCLSRPLVDTEEFQEAEKGVRNMAREELLTVLQNVLDVLKEHHGEDKVLSELLNEVSLLMGRLSSMDQLTQTEEEEEEEEASADGSGGAAVTLGPSDRFRLREKLLEMAKKKPKKSSKYESLRSEVVHFLSDTFTSHLQPPTSQPLHEVLFFHSSQAVKRQLVGLPRPALTTALANPHHYLQCKCCQLEEPSSLVTSLPDLSVAYKLHLECGRLINLYDWLQAFVSVVGQEDEEDESSARSKKIDEKLQARFVLAVSELQFLGFIKPTKRKTDHVARLTWGAC